MAKKKKTSADAAVPMTSPEAVVVSGVAAPPPQPLPPPRDAPPEKGDSLRALNSRLLKETMDRRKQVDQLQSRVDGLAGEHSLLSLLERDVTRLALAAGLAEASAAEGERARRLVEAEKAAAEERMRAAEKKLEAGKAEKDEIQRALGVAISERDSALYDLALTRREFEAREETSKKEWGKLMENLKQKEADLERLEAEKIAIGAKVSSLEEALRSTNEKLISADGYKTVLKIALDRAILEKSTNRKELELMKESSFELQNQLKTLRAEVDSLERQKEAMAKELEDNFTKVVEEKSSLEEKIATIESEKLGLEEEKGKLKLEVKALKEKEEELQLLLSQKMHLERELRQENDALKRANEKLEKVSLEKYELEKAVKQANTEMQSKRVELDEKEREKKEVVEELEKLWIELESFQKHKDRLEQELEAQKVEFEKELVDVKNNMKKIEQEKNVLQGLRTNQDSVIVNLKNELLQLQLQSSEIQELFRASDEHNALLKSNLESVESNLVLQKTEASCLRMQIEVLKKSKEDTEEELQRVKSELDALVVDNENNKKQYDSLSKEKAVLEEKLVDLQHMFEEMEVQTKASKVNIEKAFKLLRSTSDAIILPVDSEESEIAAKELEEQELKFEIQQIEKILDDIKLAFKSRIEKNEDMTRELELLQGALVEAEKKKGGIWTWLYPTATTILAAISLAYAAKTR